MNLNYPDPNNTIGNNLSALNFIFEALDSEIAQIQDQINQSILPFISFWKQNETEWLTAVSSVSTLSANWNSTYTTTQKNSAAWLTPIFTFYPHSVSAKNIHTTNVTGDVIETTFINKTLPEWLMINYPIQSGTSINYTENQKIYVQFFVHQTEDPNNPIILNYSYPFSDSLVCIGQLQGNRTNGSNGYNGYATLDCSTNYSNGSWWWAGILIPGTCDCNLIRSIANFHCYRGGVPAGCYFYVNNVAVGSFPSSINVIANMQRDPTHQDVGTRSITYVVKDCEWVPNF